MQPEHAVWIRKHSTVRYAGLVLSDQAQRKGVRALPTLGAVYLQWIAERTGLRLERVPVLARDAEHALRATQRIDVIPEVAVGCRAAPIGKAWRLTIPYNKDAIVIAMRGGERALIDQGDLRGKTVAIRDAGAAETKCMTQWMPGSTIVRYETVREQVDAVMTGHADVAAGPSAVLTPLVHEGGAARVYLSGWFAGGSYTLHMAVRADDAMLASILNEALRSMTAEDAERLYERWVVESGNEALNWRSIVQAYRAQVAWVAAAVLVLLAALAASVRARRSAVDAARARATFAATVAHEVRTPLNALLATIELLSEERLHADHRRLVERMKCAGAALLELTNKVMENDVIERGRLPLATAPCSSIELLEAALVTVVPLARRKHLSLRLKLDARVPEGIVVDEGRVKQVLVNLLGNAVKYTERGYVELRLSALPTPENGTCELRFRVRDSGPGIAADVQRYLFDPYVRGVEARGASRQEGIGLGLAIVKGLVDLMNGTVTVRSNPGRGTTFDVRIPARLSERATPARLRGVQAHIDVADLALRKSITRYLVREGATCQIIGSASPLDAGATALEIGGSAAGDGVEIRRSCMHCDGFCASVDGDPLLPGALVRACMSAVAHDASSCALGRAGKPSNRHAAKPILVVDDHMSNRIALSEQLRRLGFRSRLASDARTALKLFHQRRFAMVLLDCSLGEDDGYRCAERMRTEECAAGRPRTPIIAYSARSGQDHVLRCFDADMDGVLQKPVSLPDLERLLALWLPANDIARPPTPGDASLFRDGDIFQETLLDDLTRLTALRRAVDIKGMRRLAHRIYGAAAVAKRQDIAETCRAMLNELGQSGDTNEEAIDRLLVELTQLSAPDN
ncbi:hypothetical protein WJ69_26205 [Burkholderia ubonensis]|uniref:ATP-binding protein n=1 Tax=Burkholderia ubonensis TaxID=101571 RepID=UPI000753734C|nr:ATP-binding protein [Burkholderia ubonensis]KVO04092.1 hypothetical protein WJ69_26205 [Burkholderia ubonensis]